MKRHELLNCELRKNSCTQKYYRIAMATDGSSVATYKTIERFNKIDDDAANAGRDDEKDGISNTESSKIERNFYLFGYLLCVPVYICHYYSIINKYMCLKAIFVLSIMRERGRECTQTEQNLPSKRDRTGKRKKSDYLLFLDAYLSVLFGTSSLVRCYGLFSLFFFYSSVHIFFLSESR